MSARQAPLSSVLDAHSPLAPSINNDAAKNEVLMDAWGTAHSYDRVMNKVMGTNTAP